LSPIDSSIRHFPEGFLWGVSTAAYQVEGDNQNSQWSDWEKAGRIKSGDRSGAACDWWANAEPDFDLARELGVNALRLSVEWSRIEPQEGQWDSAALARYRELLEGLVRRGIRPVVCLHHFTNPRWFEEKGAFLHPEAPALFERFTRRVVETLGDLCQFWVTLNEPNVYAASGYVLGEFPPGKTGQIATAIRVTSALALCHLRAYRAIHELCPNAQVGWAQHYVVFEPVATVLDRWVAWAEALDAAGWDRIVAFRNTKGESDSQPAWRIALHVVNHASYHRGQITTMLRQLGREPLGTDLMAFYRSL